MDEEGRSELTNDLTVKDVSGMSRDEQQQLELQKKDISTDIQQLLKNYKTLHTANFEDFSNSLMKSVANVSHNIRQAQFEAVRHITIKNKYKALATQQKVPENPFSNALLSSEDGIKNLIAVIIWQKVVTEIFLTGWDKLVTLLEESKNIQHDKIKAEIEKDSKENLIKQQKEMFENLMARERESTALTAAQQKKMYEETIAILRKVVDKVNEIDREADERNARAEERRIKEEGERALQGEN
jgi:hypothetical protein